MTRVPPSSNYVINHPHQEQQHRQEKVTGPFVLTWFPVFTVTKEEATASHDLNSKHLEADKKAVQVSKLITQFTRAGQGKGPPGCTAGRGTPAPEVASACVFSILRKSVMLLMRL